MKLNVEILLKTKRTIMDLYRPFNMGYWRYCIAGHIVENNGDSFEEFSPLQHHPPLCITKDGRTMGIEARAAEILGFADEPNREHLCRALFFDDGLADRVMALERIDYFVEKYGTSTDAQLIRPTRVSYEEIYLGLWSTSVNEDVCCVDEELVGV